MSGTLFVLAKGQPFSALGAIVPGAQVFFYQAGTSTKIPIYTTATLAVEHTNPVEADGISGKLPEIWIDPDDGPIKYIVSPSTDSDPPVAPIDTVDNYRLINEDGATVVEGQFTATTTGASGATGTVKYRIFGDVAGVGKKCMLWIEADITGVSTTTGFALGGLPAACIPSAARSVVVHSLADDVNSGLLGRADITTGGAINFSLAIDDSGAGSNRSIANAAAFTASGTKGVKAGMIIEYPL